MPLVIISFIYTSVRNPSDNDTKIHAFSYVHWSRGKRRLGLFLQRNLSSQIKRHSFLTTKCMPHPKYIWKLSLWKCVWVCVCLSAWEIMSVCVCLREWDRSKVNSVTALQLKIEKSRDCRPKQQKKSGLCLAVQHSVLRIAQYSELVSELACHFQRILPGRFSSPFSLWRYNALGISQRLLKYTTWVKGLRIYIWTTATTTPCNPSTSIGRLYMFLQAFSVTHKGQTTGSQTVNNLHSKVLVRK